MQDRNSRWLPVRALERKAAAQRELTRLSLWARGVSAYCEWQERRTSRLVVDEQDLDDDTQKEFLALIASQRP